MTAAVNGARIRHRLLDYCVVTIAAIPTTSIVMRQ
jgi:hypothetical protein